MNILTVCSVKMIGLFVTALVGVYTIEDLWDKFGDTKMSVVRLSLPFSCSVLDLMVLSA
jgi:dolichyl-phosphate-mannose-protein mannosyltransferase